MGKTLYTVVTNLESGKKELKTTGDFNSAAKFGYHLRNQGYSLSWIFTKVDYIRIRNKLALKGPTSLTEKEIHIYDIFTEILKGE